MKEEITLTGLEDTRKKYLGCRKHTVLRHALSLSEMNLVCSSLDEVFSRQFTFNVDVKTLPVSNQKRSGRCWIFSASTILREIIQKKIHVKDQFEISQNYISYFDKLEKYNYYLENILQYAFKGEERQSRKMAFLLSGVGDGGQWDMYVDLVKKYGIVPKAAFPETAQSNNTHLSTTLLNSALRKFASEVYEKIEEGTTLDELHILKTEYMDKIHDVLTDCFGLPPQKFDFEYTDEDGHVHIEKNLTPKSFFEKYVGDEIDEFVSVIHAPTRDKEYDKTYSIELVGNVIGGKPITHLNLPLERIEELIINQLKDGEIVWFGSDVSYYGNRQDGLWDDQAFDYQTPFGFDFRFDKEKMLDFSNSMMNHAMCITGVNLDENGKPNRWKIENSWGDDIGKKGYFVMSESWFESFVYQAAVKRKYLDEKELEALSKEPVLLPPWDPFGTLAD